MGRVLGPLVQTRIAQSVFGFILDRTSIQESEPFSMEQNQNQNTQTKKTYNAPQLIEHGTVEEITGFDHPQFICSGCRSL